jgi:parallel beta-helix repeat protein
LKRTALALTLILALLISIIGLGIVKIAKANFLPPSNTVQIRSDGTIDPANASISRIGNNYTLTDDLFDTAIHVECSNIVFDGANHTLSHKEWGISGVDLSEVNNVLVRNVRITGLGLGVGVTSSLNCTVEEVTVTNCGYGVLLDWSQNSTVTRNNVDNNFVGIGIIMSNGSNIFSNNLSMNKNYAFFVDCSQENSVHENNVVNNSLSVCLERESGGLPPANNIFYLNNFINNSRELNSSTSYLNFWNLSENGNYWSDYDGTDTNGDGIGDTPFVINENNRDNYPLMMPYGISPSGPKPEPFPTTLVTASIVVVAVISVGLFVYFKKFHRDKSP